MPASPTIDSHVHFYDPARIAHPWLASVPARSRVGAIVASGLVATRMAQPRRTT